jgi:DNA repair photolyase
MRATAEADRMSDHYTNPLSLTSQFFFCGLPLRLDSYRGCGFQCSFCYARFRGGNAPKAAVIPADPDTLQRIFEGAFRADRPQPSGLIGQFLLRRVPIHFGGMSDPFQNAERTFQVTRSFLKTLVKFQYPTVISTRSAMVASDPYIGLLREMKSVLLQFSFTSTVPEISLRLEPHTPSPADLLKTMELLSGFGIPVTCRWQPYVPGVSEPARRFVRNVTSAGARHVAIEHLKLPVETSNPLWSKLVAGSGRDLRADYVRCDATRDGRELVLPARVKLPTLLEVRDAVHAAGVSFGVADNELQYLSDTECCCSGVDRFPGFEGWFKHQIAYAVRRCRGHEILYGAIAGYWTPEGSVDRWLNSHSRIGRVAGSAGTLKDHIRARWNDVTSPFSPVRFFGVEPTDEYTAAGLRVFRWRDEARTLFTQQG